MPLESDGHPPLLLRASAASYIMPETMDESSSPFSKIVGEHSADPDHSFLPADYHRFSLLWPGLTALEIAVFANPQDVILGYGPTVESLMSATSPSQTTQIAELNEALDMLT